MVSFNGEFNVVEKSDGWPVLDLAHDWSFPGSPRLGMVSTLVSFSRIKHKPFWQAHRMHTATSVLSAVTPWVVDESALLWTWSLDTSQGGLDVLNFLSLIQIACNTWKMSVEHDHAQKWYILICTESTFIVLKHLEMQDNSLLFQQQGWTRKPYLHPQRKATI